MPEFQAVMARLLERCIVPGHSVDPNNLCISSGKQMHMLMFRPSACPACLPSRPCILITLPALPRPCRLQLDSGQPVLLHL